MMHNLNVRTLGWHCTKQKLVTLMGQGIRPDRLQAEDEQASL